MPRLKRLSGAEVIAILEQFGFQVYSQRGSHVTAIFDCVDYKLFFGSLAVRGFQKIIWFYPSAKRCKLRRVSETGKETLTVPNHRQLDTGTCRAIYRQACRYIPESELFRYFYE